MKTKLFLSLALLASVIWLYAETKEYAGASKVQFRGGSYLTFDTTSSLQDEDATWTINWSELSYLSAVTSDVQAQLNLKATAANLTTVSNNVTADIANLTTVSNSLTTDIANLTTVSNLVNTMIGGTTGTTNEFTQTNTFATAFAVAPAVTLSGLTNELPHLISVSTSNFVFGAATTNATVRWIAIPIR